MKLFIIIFLFFNFSQTFADGNIIGKIYNPYVQPLEKELEYRIISQQDDEQIQNNNRHKFGYGQAISERFFTEVYLIGQQSNTESLDFTAAEIEFKWQLTEQGEYSSDWGLLFELGQEFDQDIWEYSTTLIALHEWNRWVATANISLTYEWGNDIAREWETSLASQLRYRYKSAIEPALELYLNQDTIAAGPLLTGTWRLGLGQKLNWEFGVIFGMGRETPEQNWKVNLEYEF